MPDTRREAMRSTILSKWGRRRVSYWIAPHHSTPLTCSIVHLSALSKMSKSLETLTLRFLAKVDVAGSNPVSRSTCRVRYRRMTPAPRVAIGI